MKLATQLTEIIDAQIFLNKNIGIFEPSILDCTFIIDELCRMTQDDVISFYDTKKYYIDNFISTNIFSYFENDNIETTGQSYIIDDVKTAEQLGYTMPRGIHIYRSNSHTTEDFYKYDFIIELVVPLGGISPGLDGYLVFRERDKVLYRIKYKIDRGGVKYFVVA